MRLAGPALSLLFATLAIPELGASQSAARLSEPDRVRLAEAFRLAERVRVEVWPGWERTPMAVLLVTDSTEYLVGHPRPTSEFAPLARDSVLGREVLARRRRFPPTLLATFPAVGGIATIVVGTAERTGRSSTEWVLTLLHEHFHQWQSSLPDYYGRASALGLARGDTTGQWMLDYPFPYDSVPVQRAVKALATSLAGGDSMETVARQRQALRRILSPDDDRYLEFQLWQEGVPRYVEIAAAEAAARAGESSETFRRLPDYVDYGELATRLRGDLDRQLTELSLPRERRVAFYSLGAGIALLLERSDGSWKKRYQEQLFTLLSP
jgi:hypothetical protein